MEDHLYEQLLSVQTRQDFSAFVVALYDQLEAFPDQWENVSLPAFLDALSRISIDIEGAYRNRGQLLPETPSWRIFAELLYCATDDE